MTILSRYVSREIIKYFLFVILVVVMIYVVVDFFEKIDDFTEAQIEGYKIARFFLLSIPFIISQVLPLALLIAVVVLFAIMAKHNELTALKSGGVSIISLVTPVVVIGVFMSAILFLISDRVVPITLDRANKIWLGEVRNKELVTTRKKNIWIRNKNTFIQIKYYNAEDRTINGVTLYEFDTDFNLIRRLDAQQGVFDGGRWRLMGILRQQLSTDEPVTQVETIAEQTEDFGFTPEDFKVVSKTAGEMSFRELMAYIRDLESQGYATHTQWTDLHAKLAFPLVCFVLSLIGCGLSFRRQSQENMAIRIGLAIGIAFLYWICHSVVMSMGYGEMIPPLLAAWVTNFVFIAIGLYVLIEAR